MIEDTVYAYHKNGNIKSKSSYLNNKLHGESVYHYPSGNIKETGFFLEDQKDGDWCRYDSLGYQIECVNYKAGVLK